MSPADLWWVGATVVVTPPRQGVERLTPPCRSRRGSTHIGRGGVSLHVDPVTFAITADNGRLKRRIAQHVPFACASNDDGGCVALDITSDLPDNLYAAKKGHYPVPEWARDCD